MAAEKRNFEQWVNALAENGASLTLEEFLAVSAYRHGMTTAVTVNHLRDILATLNRVEQYLVVSSGGAYPRPEDDRAEYIIARQLLGSIEQRRQDTIEKAADELEELRR